MADLAALARRVRAETIQQVDDQLGGARDVRRKPYTKVSV